MERAARLAGLAALAAALGAGAATAAAAQEQPPFRSGVDVAELDVSVVDARGRPIADLEASNFTVHVDGRPRRVVQARLLSPESAPREQGRGEPLGLDILSTSNATGGGDPRGRRIVIVVDRDSLVAGEGWHTFRAAADFIDRLHPSDQVALYPVWSRPARIQFTTDHRRVREALAGMSGLGDTPWTGISNALQWVLQRDERMLEDLAEGLCRRARRGTCGSASLEAAKTTLDTQMFRQVQLVRYQAVIVRREVERLLDRLRAVAGPKTVVWVSGGFLIDVEGTRLRRIEELAAESRTSLFTFMAAEPVRFDTEQVSSTEWRRPTHTADRGLRELGLAEAARRTGGEFYRVIGDPRRWFDRIEAKISGHYLLGVEVDPDDRVEERRRIKVTVTRSGAEVRLRHGSAHTRVLRELRPETQTAALSVDERLMAMLRSPATEPWLPLRVSTYAYPAGGQVRVEVTAEVGGNGVVGSDVTLAYALVDTWGAVVSSGRRRMTGTAANRRDEGKYVYSLPIAAGPGRYGLRVAAVDDDGRAGSVEHPLRAGVALSDAPLAFGALELAAAEAPEGGSAREVVVASGRLAVAVDVHAESYWVFNRLRVAVEVARDEEGPALVQAAAPLRGRDEAPQRRASARLAVGELTPGRYVARVRALRGADEVARVARPFRIAE